MHEVWERRRKTLGDDDLGARVDLLVRLRRAYTRTREQARPMVIAMVRAGPAIKWRSKWQWAVRRVIRQLIRQEREHKRKTAENMAESEERRASAPLPTRPSRARWRSRCRCPVRVALRPRPFGRRRRLA